MMVQKCGCELAQRCAWPDNNDGTGHTPLAPALMSMGAASCPAPCQTCSPVCADCIQQSEAKTCSAPVPHGHFCSPRSYQPQSQCLKKRANILTQYPRHTLLELNRGKNSSGKRKLSPLRWTIELIQNCTRGCLPLATAAVHTGAEGV